MAEEVEEKSEPKKKEKSSKSLLIALIVLVVVAAAGGFLWLRSGAASKGAGQEAKETGEAHGEANKEAKEGAGTVYNLDPFIVNLQDNSGTRYLKLTVNLELTPSSSTAELAALNTKIRDSLIILLSSKSYTDIGTVEGKYQLRDEIVARVNQFLVKSKVKTAYFTDFVIQ